MQRPLTSTDFMVITLGTTASTVLAQYYCQTGWTMQLSSGNTMAVATSNQMCIQRTTDNIGQSSDYYRLHLVGRDVLVHEDRRPTRDMSTGHLTGPFTASDNTSGTCDLSFTGPLTKN